MDETTVIIIIAVLVFFMMNNKKSSNSRENFGVCEDRCESSNNPKVKDNTEETCCISRCKLKGKDDNFSKLMIQRRCDGITKSLSDFGVSGSSSSSSGTSSTSSTSSTSNANVKSINVTNSLEEICRKSNLL